MAYLPINDVSPVSQTISAQDVGSTTVTTNANSQPVTTGSPTTNSTASFALAGYDSAAIQVTGVWTGTLVSQISFDGGTTWYNQGVHQIGTAYTVGSFTANFGGRTNAAGGTNWRLQSTTTWTGTATVKIVATVNPSSIYVANNLKLGDGTNPGTTANVVPGDTGFNGIATASATKTYTFTTSASGAQTILANTPTEGFSWIEVVYTSVGSGLALTGQFSTASGGTYVNSTTFGTSSGTASTNPLGVSNNLIYFSGVHGNYFQIAVSALTSGTFTGTVTLRATAPPYSNVSVGAGQNGTWIVGSNSATGSAVPANAFYEGINNGGGNLAGVNSINNVGDANNGAGTTAVGLTAYTGSASDRVRTASAASNTTGTGLLGTGMLGYDGTSYQAIGATAANSTTTGTSGISALTAGTGFTTATLTLNSGTPNTNWYDMLNYAWVSVEILTNTTPATLTFQTSGDSAQTNISSMALTGANSFSSAAPTLSTVSANGTFHGPRIGRYFRVSSNNGAGTTTLVLTFHTVPSSTLNLPNATGSNSATGSAVPANAFYAGVNDNGSLGGLHTPNSNVTAIISSNMVNTMGFTYNGSNFDAFRSATAASNTTGVGLLGMGLLASDGSNFQVVRTMIGSTDGNSGNNALFTGSGLYNNSTFDRYRNNTTGVVIAAGATGSNAGVSVTTYNAAKLLLAVNITSGAGTVTVAIQGITSSGYSYPILTSTALTGVADNVLRVFPGATPATNTVANDLVPRTIQVVTTVVGTIAYGIDYELSV